MSFFSKNLKYLRKTKNISRSELANKINVNQSTISRWENEDMGVTVDNAYDVANFFKISIADLTGKDLSQEENVNNTDLSILDNVLYTHKNKINAVKNLPEEKQEIIANAVKSVLDMIDEQEID